MSVPGIFKLGRVSIMLQILHLAFLYFSLPVKVGVVEMPVLTSNCFWKGYSNMPATKHLFNSTTLCAYRQPPNLKQMLVKQLFIDCHRGRPQAWLKILIFVLNY